MGEPAREAAEAAARRIKELVTRRQRLLEGEPSTDEDVREAERSAEASLLRARAAHTRSGLAHERAAEAHEHVATAKEAQADEANETEAANLRRDAERHRAWARQDREEADKDRRAGQGP